MDKEKFEEAKETLRKLLAIQQDHIRHTENKTEIDKNICKKFDGLIVEAAADLLDVFADEREEKPVKSEMPCNCKQGKSLQDVIENVAKRVEENLSAGKGLAAIVIVPFADLLAAGD